MKALKHQAVSDAPASFTNLARLLETKRKLVERVEALPAEIEQAERDATAAAEASVQVEVDWASRIEDPTPEAVKAYRRSLAAATDKQADADARAKAKGGQLAHLEQKVLALDEAIQSEVCVVRVDVQALASDLLHELSEALAEAVLPVRALVAQADVLARITGSRQARDFVTSAFVADPETRVILFGMGGAPDTRQNLLRTKTAATEAVRATVATRLKAVTDVLALVNAHRAYVLLSARPAAYVPKGIVVEWAGHGLAPGTLAPTDVFRR